MIGSRRMLLASGKGGYLDFALSLNPSHFWPLQGDLLDVAGYANFVSNGNTVSYPAAGPNVSPGDLCVYSTSLGLYEPTNNFNANQNTNGWSYGGWFKLANWTATASLMGCYSPIMIYPYSGQITLYPASPNPAYNHGFTNNTWHHVMHVGNPTTTKHHLYVDGVDVGQTGTGQSMTLSSGTQLNIGQYSNVNGRTTMSAAWCGWWKNVALTPAQIQKLAGV